MKLTQLFPSQLFSMVTAVFYGLFLVSAGQNDAVQNSISEAACQSMRKGDFSRIAGAPSHILKASIVEIDGIATCEVSGYTHPQSQFTIRVPAIAWNRRLYFQGCGGFCGRINIDRANSALAQGYATATTNMGHVSSPIDGIWAYDNPQAELDFAHRSTHRVTLASKAIIEALTGQAPSLSMFHGCSTGGRQALTQAERYPDDFQAIIAGAPVRNHARGNALQLLWGASVANGKVLGYGLSEEDVVRLSEHVLSQCDNLDGREDGVLDDPRACALDWSAPICGADGECLSQEAKKTAKAVYDGPMEQLGQRALRGPEFGSEPNWIGTYVPRGERPALYLRFMDNFFRYLAFENDPGPGWEPDPQKLADYYDRAESMHALFSEKDGNLRDYFGAGGKLLLYHGWRDQSIVPASTLTYVGKVTGLPEQAQQMLTFMVPGLNHCLSGVGAHNVDWLSAMEGWIETGKPPEQVKARATDGSDATRTVKAYISNLAD